MMDWTSVFLPVVSLALLCAGWVVIQLLARQMGTKNHIDHGGSSCGQCGCGGSGTCQTTRSTSILKTNEDHV